MALRDSLTRLKDRQMVRPWALLAPVVVLLVALPLLRPLRAPGDASITELSPPGHRPGAGRARHPSHQRHEFFRRTPPRRRKRPDEFTLVPTSTVPGTVQIGGKYYSDRPVVFAYLLSWSYWVMYHMGFTFKDNPSLVAYILTIWGSTLPVAAASGLIYKMGRLFELRRPVRAGLALAAALGSGWISYATVLNPHAPAAALLISACMCLFLLNNTKTPAAAGAWFMTCGFCAALAAVIDPSALIFLALLGPVILAFRWSWGVRLGGLALYAIGATPPIILHLAFTVPIMGDIRPGFLHVELNTSKVEQIAAAPEDADDAVKQAPWKVAVFAGVDRAARALLGGKGLLSHFPVLIVGVMGVFLVLRKHWPASTKMLAFITLFAAVAITVVYTSPRADWTQAMFGPAVVRAVPATADLLVRRMASQTARQDYVDGGRVAVGIFHSRLANRRYRAVRPNQTRPILSSRSDKAIRGR